MQMQVYLRPKAGIMLVMLAYASEERRIELPAVRMFRIVVMKLIEGTRAVSQGRLLPFVVSLCRSRRKPRYGRRQRKAADRLFSLFQHPPRLKQKSGRP
jgi:hypothetical protein